ncbi:hypothetical protein KFE98_20840 [bacterium SCSIO 12741]|nr:hypothetical protein KFE98_20840 [bacterium SCSIO 12741]
MDREEFFFLIPGVLYGIALFDLLSVFRAKKYYWESLAWALILFVSLVGNLFDLYPKLTAISQNLWVYLIYLLSPLMFVHACYVIASQDDKLEQKDRFITYRKSFFGALAGFILINILAQLFVVNDNRLIFRLIVLAFFVPHLFIDQVKLRAVSLVATAALLGYQLMVVT